MTTLHTVNRSPHRESTLESCLRLARPGSAVLLLEDGVYAAVASGAPAGALAAAMDRVTVYALAADVSARGIDPGALLDGVRLVDYEGFVDLACAHDKVQSWV